MSRMDSGFCRNDGGDDESRPYELIHIHPDFCLTAM